MKQKAFGYFQGFLCKGFAYCNCPSQVHRRVVRNIDGGMVKRFASSRGVGADSGASRLSYGMPYP